MKNPKPRKKGTIDRSESFDEFLTGEGLLAETEDLAMKEIITDQIQTGAMKRIE